MKVTVIQLQKCNCKIYNITIQISKYISNIYKHLYIQVSLKYFNYNSSNKENLFVPCSTNMDNMSIVNI